MFSRYDISSFHINVMGPTQSTKNKSKRAFFVLVTDKIMGIISFLNHNIIALIDLPVIYTHTSTL